MESDEPERVQLTIPGPLGRRIQALLDEPSLGFTSLEHFLMAGLHSFVSFKERQLRRVREEAR